MARGLGKGLDALISKNVNDSDYAEVMDVSLKECRPNPYQPRKTFTDEAIEELKQSIIEDQLRQVLPVMTKKWSES